MATHTRPVLWQLQISHYNEKVRWAFDYKRIPHVRRSLMPGIHRAVCKGLTGDVDTTPVVTFEDGRSIGDSTRIIAALEERCPEPPLYPADPGDRARALQLEEFFDEELGDDIRRAIYHVLLDHPDVVKPIFLNGQNAAARALLNATFPVLRVGMKQVLTINDGAAAESRERTLAALDRLEQELDGREYLVGDRFSVADLTAASLFYPFAMPPEYPYPIPRDLPADAQEFIDSAAARPGTRWVTEMYRRHRRAT